MRRTICTLLVTALAVAGVLAAPSAATAAGGVSSPDGVLFDECFDHPYEYSLSMPGSADWELEVTVTDPVGDVTATGFTFGVGAEAAGSDSFLLCGGVDVPGRYTVDAVVTWYDDDFDSFDEQLPATSFTMRRARSSTSLRVSDPRPRFNQVVRFTIHSERQKRSGMHANGYEYVALEVKANGGWSRVKRSRTITNARGNAVLRYRWNIRGTYRLRAVTLRSDIVESSTSKVRTIRTVRR